MSKALAGGTPPKAPRPRRGLAPFSGLIPLLLAISIVAAGCGIGQPAEPASFPAGLAEARVPDVELEAFVYIVGPTGGAVARELGFSAEVPAGSLSVWLAPWEGELVLGATVELPSEQTARLAAAELGVRTSRALALGRQVVVVQGDSTAAAGLAAAIERDGLVAFASRNPQAMEVIQWLPAQTAAPPDVVAYARLSEAVLEHLAQRTGNQELADVAVGIRSARISRAAVAVYAPEGLPLATLGDLEQLGDHAAGIVVAPARLPASVVGTVLRSAAGGLGLQEAALPSGPAFTRSLGSQRLYVANLGNKLYISFSPDEARAQALLDGALQRR
ncbi:MAG: hypothetical protein EXR60_00675 [Dehalococcoidia bacterium]|nr:hypothetical protein [Dehalococcoidia bacterium]